MGHSIHEPTPGVFPQLGESPSPRTLVRLAEEAVLCTPASCGAAATVVPGPPGAAGGGDPPVAVTHPDLAPLVAVQWETGEGPLHDAARTGEPAGSDDLLGDDRWPAYRAAALAAGVRSTATLPLTREGVTVLLTLWGFRPGLMDARARSAATLLEELAGSVLAGDQRAEQYEQALTEVDQLDEALRSRPVIDQACGILMHLLGCDAEAAFDLLRRQSQRANVKLADLAHEIVRTRGRAAETGLARLAAAAPAARRPARRHHPA